MHNRSPLAVYIINVLTESREHQYEFILQYSNSKIKLDSQFGNVTNNCIIL